jgi:hypothetical protein
MGLTGSLATWDFEILRHEPARRGYLWEEFDGHWAFGSMEERDMVAVNTRFRGKARERKLDGQIEAFVASEASPRTFIGLIAKYDATEPWTWPLRFVPPRLPIGPPPETIEAAIEWIREPPSGFEPFKCVAAAEVVGRASRYSPLLAAKLLLSRQDPGERKALARGLGRGLMSVTGDNPPTLRFFDGGVAYARVKGLPPDVNRADIAFGFGFRLGTVVNEFFPAGDVVLTRYLATFPADMHPGFAKGLGAGYRLRFLTPPGPGTRSPGADRLLTMMAKDLTAPFIEGFYGVQ